MFTLTAVTYFSWMYINHRHWSDFDVHVIIHVEIVSISVVDHNTEAPPVCWNMLNDRKWIHRIKNAFKVEHSFVTTKDGLTIEGCAFVFLASLIIVRCYRSIFSRVTHHFVLSKLSVHSFVRVIVKPKLFARHESWIGR